MPDMTLVNELVEKYHQGIIDNKEQAGELLEMIYKEQKERRVIYANTVVATSLRPYFLMPWQAEMLERTVPIMNSCLERIIKLWCDDAEVRRLIQFRPEEEEYFRIPSGLTRNIVVARHDTFMDKDDLQYIEFNTDSPASMGYVAQQHGIFDKLPMMKELQKEYEYKHERPADILLEALLESFKDFGLNEEPRLIITDWDGVNTYTEFLMLQELFEKNGLPTKVTDPRNIEYRNGKAYADGFEANFIYRRVIWREMLQKLDECQGLLEAAKSPTVCVANPFKSKIAGNKACLAFMRHPKYFDAFTDVEKDAIRHHVPWTSVLIHEPVEHNGGKADPFDVALKEKDTMVVKPLNDYGGRGVNIGPETSDEDWSKLLQQAEDEIGTWCVQKLVHIPEEDFPVLEPDLRFESRKINLNPYALGGRYAGSMTRISVSSIINVSAGGGMIPTFILKGKK